MRGLERRAAGHRLSAVRLLRHEAVSRFCRRGLVDGVMRRFDVDVPETHEREVP